MDLLCAGLLLQGTELVEVVLEPKQTLVLLEVLADLLLVDPHDCVI